MPTLRCRRSGATTRSSQAGQRRSSSARTSAPRTVRPIEKCIFVGERGCRIARWQQTLKQATTRQDGGKIMRECACVGAANQENALTQAGHHIGISLVRGLHRTQTQVRVVSRAYRHNAVPSSGFAESFFTLPDDLQSAKWTRNSVTQDNQDQLTVCTHPRCDNIIQCNQKCPGKQWRSVCTASKCKSLGNKATKF